MLKFIYKVDSMETLQLLLECTKTLSTMIQETTLTHYAEVEKGDHDVIVTIDKLDDLWFNLPQGMQMRFDGEFLMFTLTNNVYLLIKQK